MFDYKKLYDMVQSLKVVSKTMTEQIHYVIESNDLRLTSMDKELNDLKSLLKQLDSGELRLVKANEVGYVNNGIESIETAPTATGNISSAAIDPFISKMKGFISQWEASSENEDFFAALEELLTINPEDVAAQTQRIFALEKQVEELDIKLKDMPMNNTSSYNNQAEWMEKINNLTKRLASLEAEYASLADRLRSQSTANFGSTSDFDKGIKEMENTLAEMNKEKDDSLDKHFEDVTFSNKSQIEQREQQKPQPSYKPYRPGIQDSQNITSQIKPAQIRPAMPSNHPNVVSSVEEPKQMPNNNYGPFPEQQSNGFNVPQNNIISEEQNIVAKYQNAVPDKMIRCLSPDHQLRLNKEAEDTRALEKVSYTSIEASKKVPLIIATGAAAMYCAFENKKRFDTFYVTPAQKMYTTDNIQGIGLEEFFEIRGELRQSEFNRFSLDAPAIFKKVGDNFVIERRGVITVL